MKITLAQLNPKVGDIQGNLARALATLAEVSRDGPDLVVFPELFLMGYPPLDLLERRWFVKRQEKALGELVRVSAQYPETGLVVGAARPSGRGTGRGLYNAAVLIYQGAIVFEQPKSLLPTYDVFDEARYFDPGPQVRTVVFRGETLGLSVCEDAWNDPAFWPQARYYDLDPLSVLREKGASLLINVGASPFYAGKEEPRFRLLAGHAARHKVPLVFVNQVGANDELIFDGRSVCVNGRGEPLAVLKGFQEEVQTVDLARAQASGPYQALDRLESVAEALSLGLRDYLAKSGFTRAVVGLSGGIDSAVTVCLAVRALGPENVLALAMPSMYSSPGSLKDAEALAANLGLELKVVPIQAMYEAYLAGLGPYFEGRSADVTEENIQARIRGNILMAFSNKFGYLVLSTGNKSEIAMGYCTLYGDMTGGLAVLADVPKMMVYALARYINQDREIIPQAILDKVPSAELRPGQKDEDTLPPYALLDQILHLYIEEGFSREEIIAQGFEADLVQAVIRTVNRNEYKRKQAAPGLKVTSKAFGLGRRMPLAAAHDL